MSQETVHVERDGSVLVITLQRSPVNAVDAAMSRRMGEVFCAFRDDPGLLVAVVWGGDERVFCAGWDLKAAVAGEDEDTDYGPGGFAGLTELFDLNKPVIAAVNGAAVGGGMELALACDLIVMSEDASFSLPETGVGVAADAGGLQRLPRQLPYRIAAELLLTGRAMDASEARHYGLVNRVVPRGQVLREARELAHAVAQGAPLSVMAVKEALREMDGRSVREAFDLTRRRLLPTHVRMLDSEDHLEGPRAFAQKRKPRWQGR